MQLLVAKTCKLLSGQSQKNELQSAIIIVNYDVSKVHQPEIKQDTLLRAKLKNTEIVNINNYTDFISFYYIYVGKTNTNDK